jgi:hypothetical protein
MNLAFLWKRLENEGFCPSEAFVLRWSHVFFNEDGTGLLIQVLEGKSSFRMTLGW